MDQPPPQKFVAYPRSTGSNYGSVDKLQALGDGYLGLNKVFFANIVLLFATSGARSVGAGAFVVAYLIMFALVAALSLPLNKKIAFGKNWPESKAILASVLMGLNSIVCCGIIGYSVMQSLAMKEMKLYGITSAGFFFGRKQLNEAINNRRMADPAPVSIPPYDQLS